MAMDGTKRDSAAGALLAAALAALMVLPLAPSPVAAQDADPDPIQERIRESEERLREIRRERERLREEMDRLAREVTTEAEELQNIERQIGTSASVVAELDIQIQARRDEVGEATAEMLQTRDELTARTVELRQRLKEVYKRGSLEPVQVLLSARSFSDLLNRYKYLHLVTRYDRNLVQNVGRLQEQLERQREELARDLNRLTLLRHEKREELEDLEQLEVQRQRRLARMRTQEARAESRLAELARDEERLRELLADLERERREAERRAGRATASALTTDDIGQLGWPVEGEIAYRFGPDRQGGSTIQRDGIGIRAEAGTPVRAVEAGEVVFAAPRGLYGPTVILSHGGGYYSVYLYLADLQVREGDRVGAREVLGRVGTGAGEDGARIQFEIHEPSPDGAPRAVDPETWLRSRR